MKNAVAANLENLVKAKGRQINEEKKKVEKIDSEDLLFLQEANDSLFQHIDQLEAADARRKTG